MKVLLILSLFLAAEAFAPVRLRQSSHWKRVSATSQDDENDKPSSTRGAPPFLAPWMNDATSAFAKEILLKTDSTTNTNESLDDLEESDDEPSDDKDATNETTDEEPNGSVHDRIASIVRGNKEEATLLEPYTDGIPKEIEEVILSSNETDSDESQQESSRDTPKVVEGGPSSLLGNLLGDDDTSVTMASNSEDTDNGNEEESRDRDESNGNDSFGKDNASDTKDETLGPTIQERIAQVVTGQDANEDHSLKTENTDNVNEEESRDDHECTGNDNVDKDKASDTNDETSRPTIQERIAQVITGQDANDDDSLKTTASSDGLLSLARDFKDLLLGGDEGEGVMDNLLRKVRISSSRSSYEDDDRNYDDLLRIINDHRESIGATLRETFSPVDFSKLLPTSLFYYLEFEDARKNPSWKRMMHRFHPSVDIEKVEELNEQLYLAKQSYCDTVEEAREGLESAQEPLELVFCDTESFPGRPAHYIAIKKEQPRDTDFLDVLMVVRGTKSITDIITDCLLAPEDYRGGKVHAGFLQSGKYLAETHIDLLRKICKMTDKKRIKVMLIGHSLGGGACAVAAMELNELDDVEAEAIGFGTPSLLSRELAESAEEYITTVVSDDDIIPRLNDITVANAVLDLMEHDWTPLARRDIEHAFREIQRRRPGLMTDSTLDDAMALVNAGIERFAKPKIKETTTDRLEPVLFPPGKCIHFYRDGAGVSVTYSPCTFFNELVVSRTCLRDHLMVGGYNRIFLRVMREQDNPHFVFENSLLE
jgi:hypothetical protein